MIEHLHPRGVEGFGARLRVVRGGVTQAKLANLLGVTGTAISYWESDLRRPNLNHVQRLADVMDVDPGWLAFGAIPSATGVPGLTQADFDRAVDAAEKAIELGNALAVMLRVRGPAAHPVQDAVSFETTLLDPVWLTTSAGRGTTTRPEVTP